MAYAAVTCVRGTIRRLQNCSHISVVLPTRTRTHLELAYEELGSLQKLLERSGSAGNNSLNALDGEITVVVQKLEDSLELHELNSLCNSKSYGDLQMVNDIVNSVETVKKLKHKYIEELAPDEEEEEEDGGGDVNPLNMVGLSNSLYEIKYSLVQDGGTYLFSIIGMAGIGKTALAQRIYEDPSISKRFEYRAFIKVGQKYDLQTILAQLNPNKDDEMESLDSFLDETRHLIVLDDVWDLDLWHDYFKRRGRADKGSRILLTTRLVSLVLTVEQASYFYTPFLNTEESWDLLRIKVFPDRPCPKELENPGMQIAKNCKGLPLLIVAVAEVLSEAPETMTPEYWLEAVHKRNPVMEDAYDRILPVLYPSYNNLPTPTKACFLYMAAFPPGRQIPRSRLVNMWYTEGFLEPAYSASECFDKLILDHVVVPAPTLSSDGQSYQACSLHSVFRHLCRKELDKNQLLHIIDGQNIIHCADEQDEERSRRCRRIAVYHNVLLSIKDVCRPIAV